MKPKRILITGGTGSFGKTMLNDLLTETVDEVRILSRDEEKQDALRNSLNDSRVRFHIGDVRDRTSVDRAMNGVEAVFHAAALKQVPSCEFFPLEAVRTNILGSENVIRSALQHNVSSLVCLSTLYETLASAQEPSKSEDMGGYFRVMLDERDLNYSAYFSEGQNETNTFEDYHSHNTERLDVAGVKTLLLTLPEVQHELALWEAA